jgi:hypothetical protein
MVAKCKGLILIAIAMLALSALPCGACFSIIVGKDASTDGCVLVGHNEDDYPPQVVNHYKVPRQMHGPGPRWCSATGLCAGAGRADLGYLWSEMPGMLFLRYMRNEWG